MDNKDFKSCKRLVGFKYAFNGIRLLIRNESNALIHVIIGIATVTAGFILNISAMEWIAVVIVCGCVFAAEALNTAIERLADVVSPEYNDAIKKVKDLSAGAVLFMALTAAITGIIIFLPKLINICSFFSE